MIRSPFVVGDFKIFSCFYCLPLFLLRSLYRFFHTFPSLSIMFLSFALRLPANKRDISCFISANDVQILRFLITFNAIANHFSTFIIMGSSKKQCWKFPYKLQLLIGADLPIFAGFNAYLLCAHEENRNSFPRSTFITITIRRKGMRRIMTDNNNFLLKIADIRLLNFFFIRTSSSSLTFFVELQ